MNENVRKGRTLSKKEWYALGIIVAAAVAILVGQAYLASTEDRTSYILAKHSGMYLAAYKPYLMVVAESEGLASQKDKFAEVVSASIIDSYKKGYSEDEIQQIAYVQGEDVALRHEFASFDKIGSDGKAYFLGNKDIERLKKLSLSRDIVIKQT